MTMHFAVFLLICCLCAAEPQTESDDEIILHGKTSEPERREPTNASDPQQTCPQDIHAVLREMSALLAEQRVEMKQLQRENEAQEAKLAELDKLRTQLKAQQVKLTELDKLETQLKEQTTELIAIKARSDETENQVEALKKDKKVKQVAFSASLLASGSGTLGPFNTHTPLVFRYIVTNIGNAYNPNTGFFIAPVRGAYHFEFHIYGPGEASHPSGAVLVKNGQHVFIAYHHQQSYAGKSSTGVTLLLEVGDVVFLRQWVNSKIYDNENHHSTFSGHLLFTM